MSDITATQGEDTTTRHGSNTATLGVHHRWTRARVQRGFRVAVVEPPEYRPVRHGELFTQVVEHMVEPSLTRLEVGTGLVRDAFDLVTWPEAFVPAGVLVKTLSSLQRVSGFPCFHVGVRPDDPDGVHLFERSALLALLDDVEALSPLVKTDLSAFRAWLDAAPEGSYGVSCLFMVEDDGRQSQLRVCLHPKNTASTEEISPLADKTVTEADFTAVVSLAPPESSAGFRVNIQPLICSDYLDLQRQSMQPGPLAMVSSSPERLGSRDAPEHIDIVSVTTCTAHKRQDFGQVPLESSWHSKFLGGMIALAEGSAFPRHRFAVTILANARRIEGRSAGLSGVFVPLSLPSRSTFPDFAKVWLWGRAGGDEDNRWAVWRHDRKPEKDEPAPKARWSSLGYLATLDPETLGADENAVMMAFTLTALPRARSLWDRTAPISSVQAIVLRHLDLEDRREGENV